ncbi:MAG: 50S ribosomal protein L3 [Candidatus Aenigmatarchaeota archaeon]
MARGYRPVKGSRAYWPKKRAKRIYPHFKGRIVAGEVSPMFFAGYKAGMTQVSYVDSRKNSPTEGEEVFKAVTVFDCPSVVVCGIRVYKKNPLRLRVMKTVWNEKMDKNLPRKITIPKKIDNKKVIEELDKQEFDDVRLLVHTKPKESGIGKKKPELFEMQLSGEAKQKWTYAKEKLGTEIRAEDVFKGGDWVDVKSVTKGKGFQGPVKRFGIKIRTRKDKGKRRHTGVIGPRSPARVLPGKIAMPGQLGFQTRTEHNKRVLKIGAGDITPKGGFVKYGVVKGAYMLVSGSVPGPKKRLMMIRKAIRMPEKRNEPVEIKSVSLHSQQ